MNTELKVSVIVPCYKGEKYIASCLDRLAAQSYKNLEVIVVIDGDTDKSAEIAAKYSVKLVVFGDNRGLSAARNAGMDIATGDYIHFMDVDDSINVDFYANLVKVATEEKADIVCASMVNEKRMYRCQVFDKKKVFTSVRGKMSATWAGKWGYCWRYIFLAEMLRTHNLRFEVGRLIEDLPFTVRALYFARKVVTAPGAYYKYNYVPQSIMTDTDPEMRRRRRADYRHSKELVRKFAKEHGFTAPCTWRDPMYIVYEMRRFWWKFMQFVHYKGLKKIENQI